MYLRFLGGIFFIWPHSLEEVHKFVGHLNFKMDSIHFTMEFSRELVRFLDITLNLTDRILYTVTYLYCIPVESHSYLLYDFAHPYHCKKSIPYSQQLRARKICSSIDKHAMDIESYFHNRGYPSHLIEEAYVKARRMDINHVLSKARTPKDATPWGYHHSIRITLKNENILIKN